MHKEHSLGLYVTVMSCLVMVGVFAMDSFMPALGLIARDFSVSEVVAQQTVSAYFLGYAVVSVITGPLADSIGRKKVILLSCSIFIFTTIACLISQKIEFIIIMRAIQGASAGTIWTAGRVMTYELFPESRVKQAFGILGVIFSFGPAVAPIVGGYMVKSFSWQGSFYVMIIISVISLLMAIFYLPESLPLENRTSFNIIAIFKNYRILLTSKLSVCVLLAIAFIVGANYLYISASHQFLINLLGLEPTQFAYLYWPLMLGNLLAGVVNAKLIYRVDNYKTLKYILGIMAGAVLLNIMVTYFKINNIFVLDIPLSVYAFGVGIILPVLMVELMKSAPALRGFASSLFSIGIFLLNSVISGFILPLVWTTTLNLAILQAVLFFLGMAFCLRMLKR